MDSFLSDREISELRWQHKMCKQRRQADRIKAILMLQSGLSFEEIADYLLLDDDTVRRFYHTYKDQGLSGLLRDDYRGGAPFLNLFQQKLLVGHLTSHTYASTKEICSLVKKQWDIGYSVSGMTDLLHRLNFTYKKPRLVPGKADEKEQKKFVRFYRKLREKKRKHDQIYFADGCHPTLNPVAGYGWIRKGTDKEIPSNTGRQHLNLNGAYNPQTRQVIIHESDQINAQSTIALLEKIAQQQPKGKIIILSDNAPYYKSRVLKEYLKGHPRIVRKYLPAYSPNLNLIERLWKFYKRKILYHRYFPTLEQMRQCSLNFFSGIGRYAIELNTLMTEKFQIIKPKFSETYAG
jgi:transposase